MRTFLLNYEMRFIIGLLFFFLPLFSSGQKASTPKAPASSKIQRQMARKKWKENRRIKMEGEKNIKEHHKRIQSKDTRRKMRKDKARSKQINENRGTSFWKKLFSKKK